MQSNLFKQWDYLGSIPWMRAADWLSKYFFTGGIMPSDGLMSYFNDHLAVENHWHVSGTHYVKTSEA